MASYKLTQRAADDIEAIIRFTVSKFGVQQAKIYHDGMHEMFRFLADNPKAARLRDEIDPPVRAYPYQAHLIVYEIDDNGDVIIIRIPHSKSDWFGESES